MARGLIKVAAANDDEARERAAEKLRTDPDNIQLKNVGEGDYRAQAINLDAELTVTILPNDMEVRAAEALRAVGNGKPLDDELVRSALAQAGVTHGLLDEGIAEVLAAAAAEKPVEDIVLARADPPTPGQNASLESLGDLAYPVFPGLPICRVIPAKQPAEGLTVKGDPLPAPKQAPPRELELKAGDGVTINPETKLALSSEYGLAKLTPTGLVEVKPLLTVAEDEMRVLLTLYARDSEGHAVTVDRIREVLESKGLSHGFQADAVEEALQKLAGQDAPAREKDAGNGNAKSGGSAKGPACIEDVEVMRGDEPVPGRDARLELFILPDGEAYDPENEAAVDHRERHSMRNVHQGQELGRLRPAEPGTPGKTVRGVAIPAVDGRDVEIRIGQNVETAADGETFKSTMDGVIVYAHNELSVTDLVEIRGDVDYESGNVHIDKGSVSIKGSIRSDFIVEAAGSIEVGEAIEGATVRAGGDIEVRRGIVMHEKGGIEAGGNITAHFASNATIRAGGDVVIDNDVSNCDIHAGGKLLAVTGKGKVMGGRIRTANGVDVNELGSEMGVETVVLIGELSEEVTTLRQESRELRQQREKILHVTGGGSPREILQRCPPGRRPAMAKILKARIACEERLAKNQARLEELEEQRRREARSTVNVRKMLHPGVIVSIVGEVLKVRQPTERCQLRYDSLARTIRIEAAEF